MRLRWLVPLSAAVVVVCVGILRYAPSLYELERERERDEGREEEGFERYVEAVTLLGQLRSRGPAPFDEVAPGALASAHAEKEKLKVEDGKWRPLGNTPMFSDDPTLQHQQPRARYAGRPRDGLRQRSLEAGHHYLAAAAGGIFESTDGGDSWHSVGDGLQTQVMGAVGYSPKSGVLIAGTGDRAFAGARTAVWASFVPPTTTRAGRKPRAFPTRSSASAPCSIRATRPARRSTWRRARGSSDRPTRA